MALKQSGAGFHLQQEGLPENSAAAFVASFNMLGPHVVISMFAGKVASMDQQMVGYLRVNPEDRDAAARGGHVEAT